MSHWNSPYPPSSVAHRHRQHAYMVIIYTFVEITRIYSIPNIMKVIASQLYIIIGIGSILKVRGHGSTVELRLMDTPQRWTLEIQLSELYLHRF